MKFATSIAFTVLASLHLHFVESAPVVDPILLARTPGQPWDPKTITIDVDAHSAAMPCWEVDCYDILCLNKIKPYKYLSVMAKVHRTQVGATLQPFGENLTTRITRGIGRYADDDISAEEFPFASTEQGGRGAVITGVPIEAQRAQGGALSAAYEAAQPSSLQDNDWFHIEWQGTGSYWCEQLKKGNKDACKGPNPDKNKKFDPYGYSFGKDDKKEAHIQGFHNVS